ncbi:hypothetical protein NDU88_007124 [Pleurodeles waltl]|uniref:Uncharacterized protein n=1 Tax=Pleurodeles waltl TaxID=8319 RepID=A0AAV7UP81_PLEWA|nr:hypothetical protein NDU88_007124 [Pleurodeles waltl]
MPLDDSASDRSNLPPLPCPHHYVVLRTLPQRPPHPLSHFSPLTHEDARPAPANPACLLEQGQSLLNQFLRHAHDTTFFWRRKCAYRFLIPLMIRCAAPPSPVPRPQSISLTRAEARPDHHLPAALTIPARADNCRQRPSRWQRKTAGLKAKKKNKKKQARTRREQP